MSSRPTGGQSRRPAPAAVTGELPGHGRRLAARALDFLVVAVGVLILQVVVAGAASALGGEVGVVLTTVYWVGFVAVVLLYEPLTTRRLGATLGKRALGLRIVPVGDAALSTGQIWVRFLVGGALAVIPFGVVVYGLSVVLAKERRSLADKAALTRVVQLPTA